MNWDELLNDCVDFTRRLVQTPSMPGEETAVAELVAAELRQLGFDEVTIDGIGNVIGRVYGRDRSLGALALNSHTDHVDPGDSDTWPVPPYAAELRDGRILGRGACDMKGPLAVQVYSVAALLRNGERPRRDVVFSGVVEEETGGAGALHWIEHVDYPIDLIVIAEPSGNRLSLGHRGIVQLWLTFHGRSVHASVPHKGENPNYALATFLTRLEKAQSELKAHPLLGPTSVAPTIIEVDTRSGNVTPAWTRVLLDFRTAAESLNSLQAFVRRLAADWPHTLADAWEPEAELEDSDEIIYGFYTPPDHEATQKAQAAISTGMGRPVELSSYQFATDGRHYTPYGIPVLGYGPGEEEIVHTIRESIALDSMAEGLHGYAQLLREF